MDYEGWFKFAYITTELCYSINVIIVFIYWLILYPATKDDIDKAEEPGRTFMIWYGGLVHSIPMITVVS